MTSTTDTTIKPDNLRIDKYIHAIHKQAKRSYKKFIIHIVIPYYIYVLSLQPLVRLTDTIIVMRGFVDRVILLLLLLLLVVGSMYLYLHFLENMIGGYAPIIRF